MKLIMTRGLPASGMTMWAKGYQKENPDFIRVSNTDIKAHLFNARTRDEVSPTLIWKIRREIVNAVIKERLPLIIDNYNLDLSLIKGGRQLAHDNDYSFEVKDFTHIPLEQCIEHDFNRMGRGHVGESFIRKLFNQYLYPAQVCRQCGTKASKGAEFTQSTDYTMGECGVCKQYKSVTHPRFFGNPKF
jgi:predicted kinase